MKKWLISTLIFTLTIVLLSCNPVLIDITFESQLNTSGNARGVYAVDDYAYVADNNSGLQIINIKDKSDPKLVGSYDTHCYRVHISGNYAYILCNSAFQIINISNPINPTLVGSYNTSGNDIYILNNYAYIINGDGEELQIIDISTPAIPTLVSTYEILIKYALDIFVTDKYVYITNNAELEIINISNSYAPILAGSYEMPPNQLPGIVISTIGVPNGVYVSGKYAYMTDGMSLKIIDISNPSSLEVVGIYDTTNYIYDIFVSGNYAYLTEGGSGLEIVDIRNPSSPVLAKNYNEYGPFLDVFISGRYAYFANFSSGFVILNLHLQ